MVNAIETVKEKLNAVIEDAENKYLQKAVIIAEDVVVAVAVVVNTDVIIITIM